MNIRMGWGVGAGAITVQVSEYPPLLDDVMLLTTALKRLDFAM